MNRNCCLEIVNFILGVGFLEQNEQRIESRSSVKQNYPVKISKAFVAENLKIYILGSSTD